MLSVDNNSNSTNGIGRLEWYNGSAINLISKYSLENSVYEYELWQLILFACFIIPVIVLSIVGNIFVIIAVVKKPYLQIAGNIFLASLAVADCTIAIFVMPMNAHQLFSGRWYLKSFACRFWFSCDVLFTTASILHLFCLSVDRFLSTSNMWAFRYKAEDPTNSWRIRIMIASVWIISALLSFIPIFTDLFTTAEQSAIIDNLDNEIGVCSFVVNLPYRIISSLITFWLPGIGMIVFYCLVMRKAYVCVKTNILLQMPYKQSQPSKSLTNYYGNVNSSKKSSINPYYEDEHLFQKRDSGEQTSSSVDFKQPNQKKQSHSISLKERNTKMHREYKALKTLGTVIAVFCLCWFFFFLNYTFCNDDSLINCTELFGKKPYVDDILFWIGYSNSMINPFLYNFTNADFRRAFRSLLHLKDTSKSNNVYYSYSNSAVNNMNSKRSSRQMIQLKNSSSVPTDDASIVKT